MSGVLQAAQKECAQITADILGRIKDITNRPGVELKLQSGSAMLHDITMVHEWRNAAGEVWEIQTTVTVCTTSRLIWKEGEEK